MLLLEDWRSVDPDTARQSWRRCPSRLSCAFVNPQEEGANAGIGERESDVEDDEGGDRGGLRAAHRVEDVGDVGLPALERAEVVREAGDADRVEAGVRVRGAWMEAGRDPVLTRRGSSWMGCAFQRGALHERGKTYQVSTSITASSPDSVSRMSSHADLS